MNASVRGAYPWAPTQAEGTAVPWGRASAHVRVQQATFPSTSSTLGHTLCSSASGLSCCCLSWRRLMLCSVGDPLLPVVLPEPELLRVDKVLQSMHTPHKMAHARRCRGAAKRPTGQHRSTERRTHRHVLPGDVLAELWVLQLFQEVEAVRVPAHTPPHAPAQNVDTWSPRPLPRGGQAANGLRSSRCPSSAAQAMPQPMAGCAHWRNLAYSGCRQYCRYSRYPLNAGSSKYLFCASPACQGVCAQRLGSQALVRPRSDACDRSPPHVPLRESQHALFARTHM